MCTHYKPHNYLQYLWTYVACNHTECEYNGTDAENELGPICEYFVKHLGYYASTTLVRKSIPTSALRAALIIE